MRPFALLALLSVAACGKAQQASETQARQTLEEFSMSQSHRGKPAWTLKARLAVLREDVQETSLTEPRMEFYKDGKVMSQVESLKGTAHLTNYDVLLSSSVVLTSREDQSVLKTEQVTYSSKRKKFFTDKPILLTRPGGMLRGRGFEANPNLSEIRIFNQESVIETR